MATETPITLRLENTQDTSNKAYELYLVPMGGGWLVNFAFGKIGGTLRNGTKTPKAPLPYAEAVALLNSIVKQQTSEGYIVKGGAAPAAPVGAVNNDKVDTGLRPQLLNEIAFVTPLPGESWKQRMLRQAAPYIMSPNYFGQQKHNGERVLVIWDGGQLVGANRSGEERPLPGLVATVLTKALTGLRRTVLDGELVGDIYWVFDLLEFDGSGWTERDFGDRAMRAERFLKAVPTKHVRWVQVAYSPTAKQEMLERLMTEYLSGKDRFCAAEGMVFKLRTAKYKPGRPNSGGDQFKLKFWRDVDAIVMEGKPGKRSVKLGLYDQLGQLVEMGNCTIPVNYPMPNPGEVAKVRYLTVLKDGSLVQPQFEGVRTDKRPVECVMRQLVYYPDDLGKVKTE